MLRSATSNDRLIAFLYRLVRDHMTVGSLEVLVDEVSPILQPGQNYSFENGPLAEYCAHIASRLRHPNPNPPAPPAPETT